ncbi:hypothetical protein PHLCEN_2v10741 [Hermanssonia centrifuga]|uniref:Uncharacterized protein n=1 Tax=Hermanssonia centrifuga TaxID=98765 RepID=A0A2R6NM80_9APHY|nr:hypothetical protein PHLCEN_2v10741 [Hermanssonia centrifuga]
MNHLSLTSKQPRMIAQMPSMHMHANPISGQSRNTPLSNAHSISTSLSITSKDITAANRENDREHTDVLVEQSVQEECLDNGTEMDRMDIDEDLDKGTKGDQMDVDEDYDGGSFMVLYVPDGEVGSELEASDVESDELLHEDTEPDDRLVEVPSYRQPQHNTLPSPRKHSNIFRNAQASTGRRQVKARSGPVVEAKRATLLFRPNDLNVESIKRPYSASDLSRGRTTSSTKYSSVGEKTAQVHRARARIGENIARGWKASLVQFLRAIEGHPPSRPTNKYWKVLQEAEETMNDIDSQKMIVAPDVFIDSGLAELLRKARLRRVDERRLDPKVRGIMESMGRISDVLESRIEREGRRWT